MHVMLMYVISHLGLIFFMYPGNVISSTEQGHWLPVLVGVVIHFIFITIYMKGLSYFPKKDIIRIYAGIGKGTAMLYCPCFLIFLHDFIDNTPGLFRNYYDCLFIKHTIMGHHAIIDIHFDLYSSQRSRNHFSHRSSSIPFISSHHYLYFLHFFSKRGLEVRGSFRCRFRIYYKTNIFGKLFCFLRRLFVSGFCSALFLL